MEAEFAGPEQERTHGILYKSGIGRNINFMRWKFMYNEVVL
jgi:hypothetical protein